jgi:hypothetical protein
MRRLIQTVHVFPANTWYPVHAHDKSKYHQRQGVEARNKGVQNKEKKIFVISNADAVVHPWTVMVHFNDASSTNTGLYCDMQCSFGENGSRLNTKGIS